MQDTRNLSDALLCLRARRTGNFGCRNGHPKGSHRTGPSSEIHLAHKVLWVNVRVCSITQYQPLPPLVGNLMLETMVEVPRIPTLFFHRRIPDS